jgi:hypothetical protein
MSSCRSASAAAGSARHHCRSRAGRLLYDGGRFLASVDAEVTAGVENAVLEAEGC